MFEPSATRMTQFANVIYAYSPKNDDELELKVGDKIEVIGLEEEGWWRGKLKGRIGVFPSNFVQVIETAISPQPAKSVTSTASKLNTIFANNKTNKTSSNNSLNSNNSSSIVTGNNNHNSNNNLNMNHTQQDHGSLNVSDHDPVSSERRPKPIRGIGYGDIFASGATKPKPLPADPSGNLIMASERVNTGSLAKRIPQKPPPPAPNGESSHSNGNSVDQAPALPPKPANQIGSHMQQYGRQASLPGSQPQPVREQARVVYAYEPVNDDELAIQVDDIIDIIDKNIEDNGWWKGELRGKIGVFPDNFVELIERPESLSGTLQQDQWANTQQHPQTQLPTRGSSNNINSASNNYSSGINSKTQFVPNVPAPSDGKLKSVFAATMKAISKELESNQEKHSTPASFLSLKRNNLPQHQQQQHSATSISGSTAELHKMTENGTKRELVIANNLSNNQSGSHTMKLNHIIASRSKGPPRKPPSNILNRRLNQAGSMDWTQRETNGQDITLKSSTTALNAVSQASQQDVTPSLPVCDTDGSPQSIALLSSSRQSTNSNDSSPTSYNSIKASISVDNITSSNNNNDNSSTIAKVLHQGAAPPLPDKVPKTPVLATITNGNNNASPVTPSWMVELRKAHAEKKRDTPIVSSTATSSDINLPQTLPVVAKVADKSTPAAPAAPVAPVAPATPATPATINNDVPTTTENSEDKIPTYKSLRSAYTAPSAVATLSNNTNPGSTTSGLGAVKSLSSRYSSEPNNTNTTKSNSRPPSQSSINDTPVAKTMTNANDVDKQQTILSTNGATLKESINDHTIVINRLISEVSDLNSEVKRLQSEVAKIDGLKTMVEVIQAELKGCQSATENQRKYIKELVGNLADERKRIAAMQDEIDRNLK